MRAGLIVVVGALIVAAVVALNSLFIVNPQQQALVLQFGEVRQAIRDPGLSAKIPLVQSVQFLDKRVLDLNLPAQEIIAADQKRLVVDAFMRYRIADPVRFYQTVNNVREGATRLSTFAQSSLRAVLADATFQDIVRDARPELMLRIRDDVAARASDIGVHVVDVRIRRADLPEANSEAIFARMETEREQEARQIRAQGSEAAQRVRAAADRAATVLRAEAQREAEQIRGQGDGQANAIFAAAYSKDPQFFAFFRAMQAYQTSMQDNDTRLVLSPQSDFFRYFNDPHGGVPLTPDTVVAPTGPAAARPVESTPPAEVSVPPAAPAMTEPVPAELNFDRSPAVEAAIEELTKVESAPETEAERTADAEADEVADVEAEVKEDAVDNPAAPAAPAGDTPAPASNGTVRADGAAGSTPGGATPADGNAAATPATPAQTTSEQNTSGAAAPSGGDAAATPAPAAQEVPAEKVDIDQTPAPGRITIVRPDEKKAE